LFKKAYVVESELFKEEDSWGRGINRELRRGEKENWVEERATPTANAMCLEKEKNK